MQANVVASVIPRNAREPGSPEWCSQTVSLLKESYKVVRIDHRRFDEYLSEVRAHKAWEKVPIGNPYGTEDRMMMVELGRHSDEIKKELDAIKRQEEVPLARAQAKAVDPKGGRPNKETPTKGRSLGKQGPNTNERLLRRLARDHPDTLDAYERGEYPSVRAAAIAAGIIKPPTPFEQIKKLIPKLTDAQRQELRAMLA
jgi:hypothetical protein